MDLNWTQVILAMTQSPAKQGESQVPAWTQFFPLVLLIVVFYFILIRPQQKKAKEHAAMLKTVRPGDKIVTSSGIVGIVLTVKEKVITLRSADTKLEITKSAIAEISERSGESKSD